MDVLRNRWAPPSDGNNTEAYVAFVSKGAGVAEDAELPYLTDDPNTWFNIVHAMAEMESGWPFAMYDDLRTALILGYVMAVKDEVR